MNKIPVVKNSRFGMWTILKEIRTGRVLCKCDCGTIKEVSYKSIRSGGSTCCGCICYTRDGLSKHPLFNVWSHMVRRCYNKKDAVYHNYGGRGIRVAKVWGRNNPNGLLNFINWAENNGWKKDLEIDRENNNGHYTPNNCRFVTRKINTRNRRTNLYVEFRGENMSFAEFIERFSNKNEYPRLYNLYVTGHSLEDILTIPRTNPRRLSEKEIKLLIKAIKSGERNKDIAERFNISPQRVSDYKREFVNA